jgi:hypothetical protein
MEDVEVCLEDGFNAVLHKLEALDESVGRVRLDRLEFKLDQVKDELEMQHDSNGTRMDGLEVKLDHLTDVLKDLRKFLPMDINRQVETQKAHIGIQCEISEQLPSVPDSSPVISASRLPLSASVPRPSAESSCPVPVPSTVTEPLLDDHVSAPPIVDNPASFQSLALEAGIPSEPSDVVPTPGAVAPLHPANPQVRPGVNLISATPENSQELLQPATQILLAAAITPLDAPPMASLNSLPTPIVPVPVPIPAPTSVPIPAPTPVPIPIPVPSPSARPMPSRKATTEGLLTVPPVTVDNDAAPPSLRRSPRQLSPSPALSNTSRKRKDGPVEPSASQTKKARR